MLVDKSAPKLEHFVYTEGAGGSSPSPPKAFRDRVKIQFYLSSTLDGKVGEDGVSNLGCKRFNLPMDQILQHRETPSVSQVPETGPGISGVMCAKTGGHSSVWRGRSWLGIPTVSH